MLGTHLLLVENSPQYADLVGSWAPESHELPCRLTWG
jgi:hypothetical protein